MMSIKSMESVKLYVCTYFVLYCVYVTGVVVASTQL